MIDTIDSNLIQKIAESLHEHVKQDAVVHTLTVELNGAHGGVDVTALTSESYQVGFVVSLAELKVTWAVS